MGDSLEFRPRNRRVAGVGVGSVACLEAYISQKPFCSWVGPGTLFLPAFCNRA